MKKRCNIWMIVIREFCKVAVKIICFDSAYRKGISRETRVFPIRKDAVVNHRCRYKPVDAQRSPIVVCYETGVNHSISTFQM